MDLRHLMDAGPVAKRRRLDISSTDAIKSYSLTNDAFTVGWICALDIELAPSIAMLDEEFPNLPQILGDSNTYTLGRIGNHNVVLACLPAGTTGTNAAATAATNMMRSFPNIRFGLMVGIGGGAPDRPSIDPRNDIRLGDVVVSCPTVDSSGVLQYDFGKTMGKGKFVQTGTLNKTSMVLRTGISKLRAQHRMEESQMSHHIATMFESNDKMRKDFNHPGQEHDQLFRSDYDHIGGQPSCAICDTNALLARNPRTDDNPVIHYGLIGSANQVMRHGVTREKLRREKGIICFEMEAAGLMDTIPCLAIRGICDYADSHKNKRWQPYAAATAAAYAKELLSVIPAAEVDSTSITNATNMHDMLRSIICELNIDQLLQLLPVLEQKQPSLETLNLDTNEPQFSWVFRNIDYKSWKSNDGPSALCLSNPQAHHLSQISSYLVFQEEKLNHPALYCTCSQITSNKYVKYQSVPGKDITVANLLIYTLLKRTVNLLPTEEKVPTVRNFFNALLQKSFEKGTTQHWIGHGFNKKNLLEVSQSLLSNAETGDLLNVLHMTLDNAKRQYHLVVIDEIWNDYEDQVLQLLGKFVNDLQRQNPNVKILLAGPAACKIRGLPRRTLLIEHDEERKECLSTLKFQNTRYEKISPEHNGSFEWIWTHNECKSWSTSETSRLLYIQGKPGSGKSTLTKYFNSNLKAREPAAQQAIVARFFYSFREGELQRSHYNMLLSLLHDILTQEEAFFYHHFQAEYRSHRRSKSNWDYISLKRTLSSLQDYRSISKRLYLIIDAIDESEERDRRNVLNLLYDLCSKMRYCVIKIYIASRPVTQLEARRDQFLNFIRLQDETMHDISNFANSLLDGLDLDLTREISYIIENAQGVFLWVKLVGKELLEFYEDGYSEHDIFLMLKQLPTELEEFYVLMLDKMRANKSRLSYALRMFHFILFAQRPLRVNELLHSLSISDNIESDSISNLTDEIFEERVPLSERIIVSCGGNFIEIKQRNDGHKVVQVIHQTALEFLRDPHGVVSESEFCINEGHAHMCITTTCIRYLMLCAANTPLRAGLPNSEHWTTRHDEYYADYLNKRPLVLYASHHLEYHVKRYKEHANQNFSAHYLEAQITVSWINNPFMYLLESWVGSQLDWNGSRNIQNGLLVATAKGGLDVVAEILLSAKVNANIQDESGRSPLSWAAGNGHNNVSWLLLEKRVVVDCSDYSGRTPLSWAAGNGQEFTTSLLLGRRASGKLPDNDGRTPLSWAAGNGQESTTRLLLRDTIDYPDHSGRTPLSWAAGNGQESISRLLLETNADFDYLDFFGRTPLSWAAGNGQESTTSLLLETSASGELPDNDGRTPLSWAAGNGQKSTASLLLERHASSELPDGDGRTPLSWAAGNGQESTVKLLLETDAAINLRDCYGRTPIAWATANMYWDVTELLREKGASTSVSISSCTQPPSAV